jgi:hypothetical protein
MPKKLILAFFTVLLAKPSFAQTPGYLARMHRVVLGYPQRIRAQRTCILIEGAGNARLEQTYANSLTVGGGVFTFTLTPEQQLKPLLSDPTLRSVEATPHLPRQHQLFLFARFERKLACAFAHGTHFAFDATGAATHGAPHHLSRL